MRLARLIFIGFLLIGCIFVSNAAVSGVRPAIYTVDFKPGLSKTFVFNYYFEGGPEADVYLDGDLAKYVQIDKTHFKGTGTVVATLNLPDKIDVPGVHRIRIGAKQLAEKSGRGIALIADVGGIIKVVVPYPGEYLEASLSATKVNVGEPSDVKVKLKNKGTKNVSARVVLRVYDSHEKLLDSFELGNASIPTTESKTFQYSLSTKNYVAGDYRLKASVEYGTNKHAVAEGMLRIGHLFVDIVNYTKEIKRGGINRFNILVESFWNDEIKNVYVEGKVIGKDVYFKTPSADLGAWKQMNLVGFFDTTELEGNYFDLNLIAHYEGKSTRKNVRVNLTKEKTDYTLYLVIVIPLILIIILLIILIIYLRRGDEKKKK